MSKNKVGAYGEVQDNQANVKSVQKGLKAQVAHGGYLVQDSSMVLPKIEDLGAPVKPR